MACWMPGKQMGLLRAESDKNLSRLYNARASYDAMSPLAVSESPEKFNVFKGEEVDESWYAYYERLFLRKSRRVTVPSSLSMSSRMSYFTDRIISPEGIFLFLRLISVMRAMCLLYLGTSPVVYDFNEDFYLSPIVTPDEILERFPKTFFITGEKDPIVDDSTIINTIIITDSYCFRWTNS